VARHVDAGTGRDVAHLAVAIVMVRGVGRAASATHLVMA